jgi:hypothetical protein
MASGQERALAADEPDKEKVAPLIDAGGTEVFYSMVDARYRGVYVVLAQGGAKRKICDNCGPAESLSPDGRQFLATRQNDPEFGIDLIDIASGKSTPILQHSQYQVGFPRFSPDGKWILFEMWHNAANEVMLAPFRGAVRVPEQDWIAITPAPGNVNSVFWSPDGGLIYYVISSGGSPSLMARRLDRNHHPTGAPFRVFQFPARIHPQATGISLSDSLIAVPGRFIGAMPEVTFNIWMMNLPK